MIGWMLGWAMAVELDPVEVIDQLGTEIWVFGDPFRRWDHTRWYLRSQVSLPLGGWMYSEVNTEARLQAFDIAAVLLCDKDEPLSRTSYEVRCVVEQGTLGVAVFDFEATAEAPRNERQREQREEERAQIEALIEETRA